jgi:hypothetical protein
MKKGIAAALISVSTALATTVATVGDDAARVASGVANQGDDVVRVVIGLAKRVPSGVANQGDDAARVASGVANQGDDAARVASGVANQGDDAARVASGVANLNQATIAQKVAVYEDVHNAILSGVNKDSIDDLIKLAEKANQEQSQLTHVLLDRATLVIIVDRVKAEIADSGFQKAQ